MQIASEPKMPIGRSRCGFFVSSAAVATMSKPMNAKNTSAAALKMPPIPNVPVLSAEVLQQRRRRLAARARASSRSAG